MTRETNRSWSGRWVTGLTLGLAASLWLGCPADPVTGPDGEDVASDTAAETVADGGAGDTPVDGSDATDIEDAVGDSSGDALLDGADGDATVATDDAASDGLAEVDTNPPPPIFPEAPDHFYQVKIEGIELGTDGESDLLKVNLPEGTTSAFVMLESADDFHFLTLKTVVTPKPFTESIVLGAGLGTCIPCKNRVSAAQKVAAFLFANDPAITSIKGGDWRFKVGGTTIIKTALSTTYPPWPGFVDMTILARTEPIPTKGLLRLRLHFTGADGLTAATAPTDVNLEQALVDLKAILGTAGITVEVAGYHDVAGTDADPGLVDLESTIGAPNDLSKVFLAGQSEDTLALNVFFVNSIFKDGEFAGGGLVLGIAAGIPGPAFLGPNYRSGVAIATLDPASGTGHWGNVIAHEIGHFLGLYHSTEKSGAVHDTLDDTPDDDGTNLLFWAYSEQQLAITEQQGIVMRSHPFVLPLP